MFILVIHPTNDFNKISLIPEGKLTPAQQNILMIMARNGDSIVNPFSAELDREGRTPEGRARKEREERRAFREMMERLEEQRVEFRRELDRMEQASLEALHENEEQQREARKELQRIQDSAYQIHMPDGSVERVYRDGDKVRMETGAEVSPSIVKADDLGSSLPSYATFKNAVERGDRLKAEHQQILEYQKQAKDTQEREAAGSLSDDEREDLRRKLKEIEPERVRAHEQALENGNRPLAESPSSEQGSGLGRSSATRLPAKLPRRSFRNRISTLLRGFLQPLQRPLQSNHRHIEHLRGFRR